ncbi:transcription elongation factor GreAB [Paenibacillus sp. PCH8]|uniref:GreA/GreB family elongation factor n=1 Tax=Paenibacillus sp. PCH8 TaxID=2066524 RepID=UPI000CF9866C|nr:GreA/GreB family elongation factor [Paenibacillus sp. PCH8]PQP85084.1 transcription elongation factor GreAB [Paenibacillus sp. PCH8]
MNHRTSRHNCREKLVSQLLTLGEEKRTFLDAYFDARDPQRIQLERQLVAYTQHVEKLLLGPDEDLDSVVLIGSHIDFEYIDFHTSDSFMIVMPDDTNPDEGRISFLSPVGRQLLLGFKGEVRSIQTPSGSMRVRIKGIELKSEALNETLGGADHAL